MKSLVLNALLFLGFCLSQSGCTKEGVTWHDKSEGMLLSNTDVTGDRHAFCNGGSLTLFFMGYEYVDRITSEGETNIYTNTVMTEPGFGSTYETGRLRREGCGRFTAKVNFADSKNIIVQPNTGSFNSDCVITVDQKVTTARVFVEINHPELKSPYHFWITCD